MKIISLIFLMLFSLQLLTSDNPEKAIAQLTAECTIKIMKARLQFANNQNSLTTESNQKNLVAQLYNLYDQCSTIINSSHNHQKQHVLQKDQWTQNIIHEIKVLQQDAKLKNCTNQAMIQLQNLATMNNPHEKNQLVQQFFKDINDCSYERLLRISMSSAQAIVQYWKDNPDTSANDDRFFNFYLLHATQKQPSFDQDVKNLYDATKTNFTFTEFQENLEKKISKINKDPQAPKCLEIMIKFKEMYHDAQSKREKAEVLEDFAIPYYQCKQK